MRVHYFIYTLLFTASLALNTVVIYAQKVFKISVHTGSGISFFGGKGAVKESSFIISDVASIPTVAEDPFGKKALANFIAGAGISFTCRKIIYRFDAQYEHSGGRLKLDTSYSFAGERRVDGIYKRTYDFISLNPQIGYIICEKKVRFSINAGFDYTSKLELADEFDYKDHNGDRMIIGYSGGEPEINDSRITTGVTLNWKKWNLDLLYKHGLKDYTKEAEKKVYSRLIHFRLGYVLFTLER